MDNDNPSNPSIHPFPNSENLTSSRSSSIGVLLLMSQNPGEITNVNKLHNTGVRLSETLKQLGWLLFFL